MTNNLVFHYKPVLHNKTTIILHEAFSLRNGELYSLNPVPAEVNGENEEEIELVLQAMERDKSKYPSIEYAAAIEHMEKWQDEFEIMVDVEYDDASDDELAAEDDYYKPSGEILDLVEYIKKRDK